VEHLLALDLQGGAPGGREEVQAWGGKKVGSEEGGQEASFDRFYTRGPLHYLVGQCSHGHQG